MRQKQVDDKLIVRSLQLTQNIIHHEEISKDGHKGTTASDAVITIVNHYINAKEEELLQLTKVPKNVVFDIAYDVTQRAILDKQRIAARIPLSAIFLEIWLMGIRGADGSFADKLMDTGQSQVQAMADRESYESHER